MNTDCTSLSLSPSGHLLTAGFSSGAIRLYSPSSPSSSTAVAGDVASIRAKGLHTNLLLTVAFSPDCRFFFGGVLRGSVEMVAVDVSRLERHLSLRPSKRADPHALLRVHRHSDAKLKGFGACTREAGRDRYLVFAGRGIKNIHIWSFTPPAEADPGGAAEWSCLVDTQSNGMTVSLLQFRHAPSGLQAVSKSDSQCIRLWELGGLSEETKRPKYRDVPNTQDTVSCHGR